MRRACRLAAAMGLAGCTFGPPPVAPLPLAGPMPRVVAIWPILPEAYQPHDELLLGSLGAALRARGAAVVAWAVAQELLRGTPVESPQDAPAALRERLGADAVMQLVVTDFAAQGRRPLQEAQWDLTWRLVSLHDGKVQWSCTQRGHYVPPRDDRDPHRPFDAEPDVVPIGGDRRIVYRDAAELMAALHRLAMAQLPARSR